MIFQEIYAQDNRPLAAPHTRITGDMQVKPLARPGTEIPEPNPIVENVVDPIYSGAMSGLYQGASAAAGVVSGVVESFTDEDNRIVAAIDDWSKDVRETAEIEYSLDPETNSAAAGILYGLSNSLTKYGTAAATAAVATAAAPVTGGASIAVGTGITAGVFGLQMGVGRSQELKDKGVDEETANKAGLVSGAENAFWSVVPGFFGFNFATRAATGAGMSAFSNANEMAIIHEVLERADYSDVAEDFEITGQDLAISAVMGVAPAAGVSYLHYRRARRAESAKSAKESAEKKAAEEKPQAELSEDAMVPTVEQEDAARYRIQEISNTAQLPVDQSQPEQVTAARREQAKTARAINRKQKVRVDPNAVDPEKMEKIREASTKRLAEQTREGGFVRQNRDRTSKESIAQMNGIASNPQYLLVSTSRSLSDGAPVITNAGDIPDVQLGRADKIVDAKGQVYDSRYAVVDADQVLTSNNIDGTPNPEYQVEVLPNPYAVSGNGRITGLRAAYERGTADEYRRQFIADSEAHGISPDVIEGIERPILVRIIREEDMPADIVDRSNQRTTAEMNYIEQAIQDSARIDLAQLSFREDGSLDPIAVSEFVHLLPTAEQGQLIVNGIPTEAARKRLDAAIFQRAYGQPGLTQLLDSSQVPRGIQGMLRAMREVAPRVLDLDDAGELDFRTALAEVMNEVQANRASGKNLSLRELADQQTLDRSPEAQAFLDYLAMNEENKGGYKALVQTFQELTDWVKAQQESLAQGDGLFGAAPKPTRRDLMREFARITGQKFDPTQYNRFDSMHETVKAERLEEMRSNGIRLAEIENGIAPIEEAPNFELIEVGRSPDGQVHRVYGVDGDPNLAILPSAEGIKPLPLRLQEGTMVRPHIRSHLKDVQAAGYKSVEQAIWDIAKNFTQIYEGTTKGRLVLVRPLLVPEEGGKLRRGVLFTELQETAGAYRVGSVTASSKKEYLKKRQLLWEKTPTIRLQDASSGNPRTRELTGPQQPSLGSIGEVVGNVNDYARAAEASEEARDNRIIEESRESIRNTSTGDGIQDRAVMDVLDENPQLTMSFEDGSTIKAAEYVAREDARAADLEKVAQEGITTAVICALQNNGL